MIINPVHEKDLDWYRRTLNMTGIDLGYSHALDAYVLFKQLGGCRFGVMEASRSSINSNPSGAFRLMEAFVKTFDLNPSVQSFTIKGGRFVPTSLGNLLSWNTHDDWDGVRWDEMGQRDIARTLAAFVELSWGGSPLMDQLVELAKDLAWSDFALLCKGSDRLRRCALNYDWAIEAMRIEGGDQLPEANEFNIRICEAHRSLAPSRNH